MAIGNCHDPGAFSAFGRPNAMPLFQAAGEEPSLWLSSGPNPPRSLNPRAMASGTRSRAVSPIRSWNRPWQALREKLHSGRPGSRIPHLPDKTIRWFRRGRLFQPGPLFPPGSSGPIHSHCPSVRSRGAPFSRGDFQRNHKHWQRSRPDIGIGFRSSVMM